MRKNVRKIILTLLILLFPLCAHAADKKESVSDRVLRTGVIRCGYALWPPGLIKDPNTGALSGISKDLMDEIGKRLSLKTEWAEEAGWGNIVEGLVAGRYDMICGFVYANSARSRVMDFSIPVAYSPLYIVVRADDRRFDANLSTLNDPQYKIAILEGEQSAITQRQNFPHASVDAIPQMSDYSVLLKDVETGKADATTTEPGAFGDYNLNNPGKLKLLDRGHPLNVFPIVAGLPRGDPAFKRMIDVTLGELQNDGTIDRLLDKYLQKQYKGIYLRLPQPYAAGP